MSDVRTTFVKMRIRANNMEIPAEMLAYKSLNIKYMRVAYKSLAIIMTWLYDKKGSGDIIYSENNWLYYNITCVCGISGQYALLAKSSTQGCRPFLRNRHCTQSAYASFSRSE